MAGSTSRLGDPDTGDDVLVHQVAQGSAAALASLYDRHAGAVFRLAMSMGRDRGMAEEIVQETFLALWNRADRFDPGRGPLGTWLAAIARNRAVDRLRATARRIHAAPFSAMSVDDPEPRSTVEWLVASGELLAAGAADPEPEAALVAREDAAAVRSALAGLTKPEREAIVLAYRDGLSQSEIATHLGWPLGTVKTRSRRALRRLRETLEAPTRPDIRSIGTRSYEPCPAPC